MQTNTSEENCLSLSKRRNRDIFSELDVLLRALDRFFNVENLPASKEDLANKNFFDELSTARDVTMRVLGLLESIIPDNKKNIYWFQRFAQAKFLTDKKRDAFRENLYKQDMPGKSLLLLYDSFLNIKGIITDILKNEHIPFLTYTNIGHLVGKELRENIYFNPFKKELNPDFDIIENREISRIVKGIKEKSVRKYISIMFLHLFKFLRCLRHAETSYRLGSISSSLLIILLLRPEITLFRVYMDRIASGTPEEGPRMLIRAISYQFSIESKRVYLSELKDVFSNKSHHHPKSKVENSCGILKNLSEQCITQLVQFFSPETKGTDIFDSFVTKLEQSLKLREDILVLHRFLSLMGMADSKEKRAYIFDAMRNYMLYFQSFTFRLLRYSDYEEFVSFFDRVLAYNKKDADRKDFDKLLDRIKQFRILVETGLRQISNRSELTGRPADMERVENSLSQYLK